MLNSSQRRPIYPDISTQYHIQSIHQDSSSESHVDQFSLSSSDDQRYFFSADIDNLRSAYLSKNYQAVLALGREAFKRFHQSSKSETIKKNVANLTLDLSKLRSLMANAYLHLYQREHKEKNIEHALKCLTFQYEGIETPYKRAQRLNNLGLCELLEGRCNNAFQHFSAAFRSYMEEDELQLSGLIKNIAQVYKRLEMYSQAVKYLGYVLEQLDKNGGQLNEYACLVVSALQCINQLPSANPLHLSICQRVKQLMIRLDKQRSQDLMLRFKLRLQLLKFAVKFGIEGQFISQQETQKIFHQIFGVTCNQPFFKFIKGQCCYVYRQHFRGNNWEKYRELSRLAEACFRGSFKSDNQA